MSNLDVSNNAHRKLKIDLTSKVVVKLVDVIKSQIGKFLDPLHMKRKAKAQMKIDKMKALNSLELGLFEIEKKKILDLAENNISIEYRALERLGFQELKRQNNIENIAFKALEFAADKKDVSDNVPEDEWLAEFFNLSQDCSNPQLQYIWARLLADEVDKPGSFSRRTLHTIKLLSPDEAVLFNQISGCVVQNGDAPENSDFFVMVFFEQFDGFKKESIGFSHLEALRLIEIGLLREDTISIEKDETWDFKFFDKSFSLTCIGEFAEFNVYSLTKIGEEIFSICNPNPNMAYYKILSAQLKAAKQQFRFVIKKRLQK